MNDVLKDKWKDHGRGVGGYSSFHSVPTEV